MISWGNNSSQQTNVPSGMSNVMAIAGGSEHSIALINDRSLVSWGDNTYGQTNTILEGPGVATKLIAAGGSHSLAAIWSSFVQYPVDVSKDLILIYNTTSTDSSNVCQYYRTNRPMVANANVFGINCTNTEIIFPPDFTNIFMVQIQGWLAANPTIRPQYVVLFQDIPSRSSYYTGGGQPDEQPSVQYQLNQWCVTNWHPFVTAINMNGIYGTNDCIAYINKLTNMAGTNRTLFISANANGYDNTNWYFDYAGSTNFSAPYVFVDSAIYGADAKFGVTNASPLASAYVTTYPSITVNATNVVGYFTCGYDCSGDTNMFIDTTVHFSGQSQWFIMSTIDSFSGERNSGQAGFLTWFASNSFDGTNYSNTPIAAVSYVDEPDVPGHVNPSLYYGSWAAGKSFALSAWIAQSQSFGGPTIPVSEFQAIGDPFVKK